MSYEYEDAERPDYQQQAAEELRRYAEEHPLWDKCRNHPDRYSVGPHCVDTQYCAECIECRREMYVDAKREAAWPDSYDMDGYHDRPTNMRNFDDR